MAELINNKILIIKGILAEKCGLNPDLYDELSELLDDVKILSDAKSSALENAYTELRQLTLPVVSKSCDKCKFVKECRYKPDNVSNVCRFYIKHVC